jgi:hypothetical protein
MRRLFISAAIGFAIAISPLSVLCGPDCDSAGQAAAAAEASCPLHDAPPHDHHDTCDHEHAVAPATAGKTDQAITAQNAALEMSQLDQRFDDQVAPALPDVRVDSSPAELLARRFLPLRI